MAATRIELIRPDWPAPTHVHALATTRHGGFSSGSYASLNLGTHVGDDARLVDKNRRALDAVLGIETAPSWLDQMHGTRIVATESIIPSVSETFAADASITSENHTICAIMTADCLPVLLTDRDGLHVAAAHAGWRGLVAGVLENTVGAFVARGVSTGKLIAWLGPAISSGAYEVDAAVVGMLRDDDQTALMQTDSQHWQFDLYALARLRLAACGVAAVFGGGMCTFAEPERFFSYRRDGVCGRQATLIWIE